MSQDPRDNLPAEEAAPPSSQEQGHPEGAPESAAAPEPGAAAPAGPADPEAPIDMSTFEEQVEDSELSTALARIAELEDQLARANASLYNLDQEYAGYVRRSKEAAPQHRENGQSEVLDALMGVLDDVHAARQAGDLTDGPFAAIATKLEETLSGRFGLERFGAEGDDFDPTMHEALMARTSSEVDHPVIAQVLQPGYRRGERVLRAVKVLVDNPE